MRSITITSCWSRSNRFTKWWPIKPHLNSRQFTTTPSSYPPVTNTFISLSPHRPRRHNQTRYENATASCCVFFRPLHTPDPIMNWQYNNCNPCCPQQCCPQPCCPIPQPCCPFPCPLPQIPLPVYETNAAAIQGGVPIGGYYRDSNGFVRVVFQPLT